MTFICFMVVGSQQHGAYLPPIMTKWEQKGIISMTLSSQYHHMCITILISTFWRYGNEQWDTPDVEFPSFQDELQDVEGSYTM